MDHGLPPEDWDTQLLRLGGSFLQSRPWAAFQQAQGRTSYWARAGDGSWQWQAALQASHGLRYLRSGYGPAGEEGAMEAAIASLEAAGHSLGADFIRLEPQAGITAEALRRRGAVEIAEADPKYTRIVNLTHSIEELRRDLAASHRNNINGTERRGITIRQADNPAALAELCAMLRDTAIRSKVRFYPDSYYHQLYEVLAPLGIAKLYLAEAEGQPVAGALFYDWGPTRYYAHAGAYQERNRRLRASVSLVWQALVDAKEAGLQHFDLWGVAPKGDATHQLAGLSAFKQGFGGHQINYLGTWDLPLKTQKYRLYSVYRRLRGRR